MKRILSLLLLVVLLSSLCFSAFAATQNDKIHVTLVSDKNSVVVGEDFTISVMITANGTDAVSFTSDANAMFGIFFDSENLTDYVIDSETAANYETAEYFSDFDQFWFQAGTLSCTPGTAVAKIKFTPSKAGTYNFTIDESGESTGFVDGVNGAWDSTNDGVVFTNVTVTVTEGSTEPEYPYVDTEEVFTDGTYAGITTTAATKAVSVFGKAPEGGLAAGAYGAKVVMGGKTFKFAGLADVEAGKVWAVKIVSPDGTFAFSDGTTLADYQISAY